MEMTKSYLTEHYLSLGKSQKKIAQETGFSQAMISLYMKEFGITPRASGRQVPDLTNQKFGKLIVLSRKEGKDKSHPIWECKCECGVICSVTTSDLSRRITCPECGHKRGGRSLWKGAGEISGKFWSQVTYGAKARSITVSVTPSQAWDLYLKQNKCCALSGVPIQIQRDNKNTASLDRIDSSKGYSIDNVQWVHKEINIMKMAMSVADFTAWCKLVVEHST